MALARKIPIITSDRLALYITAFLISIASVSWAATYYLMPLMTPADMGMMGVSSIVSSLSVTSVGLFELIWTTGMVAMMFPSIVPVVVFYYRMATRVDPNPSLARGIGTLLFLLGYLGIYAGLGLLAYVGVFAAINITAAIPVLSMVAFLGPSLVLMLAGVYQLSPMKLRALSHCVSPLAFFAIHMHKGLFGSLRMGVSHGFYCVGCCWAFMLVMLAVGAMSLPFMAALAAIIAFEKVIVRGALWFGRAVAIGFVAAGALVLLFPSMVGMQTRLYHVEDLKRALLLCGIVGTWLVTINQGGAIARGQFSPTLYLQIFLDYATPFTVSSLTGILRNRSGPAAGSKHLEE